MITLFVISLGVLFALLSISPLLDSDDSRESLSADLEPSDVLQA